MPWHIHPSLRDREQAAEKAGIIQTLNSVGYNVQVAAEAAGIVPQPAIAVGVNHTILGQSLPHKS